LSSHEETSVTYPFIKGLKLSAIFYEEAVKPLLAARFPHLIYSAARLDSGSDVLGFDTPQSMDHDWGPKLTLFLTESDYQTGKDELDRVLRQELPREIHGYPTNFAYHNDGTTWMSAIDAGPVNHGVKIDTLRVFFEDYLRFNPHQELRPVDWLTFPEQRLRTVASGRVFYDGLGQLESIQAQLSYYPRQVWLYLLAVQWRRISQEEPFVGRCGQAGDDLGSAVVAARLVRDVMKLCFLLERQYASYTKWFGTAFAQLACAAELTPLLTRVLHAASWQEREKYMTLVYEFVARKHNELGITDPLPAQVSHFYGRPFLVIQADSFAEAIRAVITDAEILALPAHLGAIDQFIDSTDVLSYPERFTQLKVMY
jgi:hypothetical protein